MIEIAAFIAALGVFLFGLSCLVITVTVLRLTRREVRMIILRMLREAAADGL